jgi:peptidase M48-like protein
VLLSTVFVGDWLYLSVGSPVPGRLPPLGWLAAPALVAVLLTAALVLAAPRMLERRGRLVAVPPDLGAAALRRIAVLAAELGLRSCPRPMWNPTRITASAFAYGRPGDYRIALTPSLLGAARRHPQAFDDVARHELAHVRNGDVLLALSALYCWYAVLLVLAAPLAVRLTDHDWSLVPDYLLRAAVLALLLYLIRARLLRSRETWADVLAASRAADPAATARRCAAAPPPGGARSAWFATSWLALHPTPAQRAAAITHPAVLGRPDPGEWLFVGVLAGVSVPLVGDLILGAAPAATAEAETAARGVVYLGVGLYAAISLVRAFGTGALSRGAPVLLATALAAGVLTGTAVSLGRTGLATTTIRDVAEAMVTAGAAAAVLVIIGSLAWMPSIRYAHRLRIAALVGTAAILTALAAAATALGSSQAIPEGRPQLSNGLVVGVPHGYSVESTGGSKPVGLSKDASFIWVTAADGTDPGVIASDALTDMLKKGVLTDVRQADPVRRAPTGHATSEVRIVFAGTLHVGPDAVPYEGAAVGITRDDGKAVRVLWLEPLGTSSLYSDAYRSLLLSLTQLSRLHRRFAPTG